MPQNRIPSTRSTLFSTALAGALLFSSGSLSLAGDSCCSSSMTTASAEQTRVKATRNIVETAQDAGSFGTLLAAAKAAGLADLLASEGPFTVLAPTDEAFAKLPDGTVASLLEPKNKQKLADILKYHVIAGRATSADVANSRELSTALGQSIPVTKTNGSLRLGSARLLATDIASSNGIIHVIDSVLLPPKAQMNDQSSKHDAHGRSAVADAMDLIDLAIERGVPLFNNGNAGACAAVYEIAVESLLLLGEETMSARNIRSLDQSLAEAHRTSNDRDRAWVLRRALDRSFEMMSTSASR